MMQLLSYVIGADPTSLRRIVQNLTHHLTNVDSKLVREALAGLISDRQIKKMDGDVEAYQKIS